MRKLRRIFRRLGKKTVIVLLILLVIAAIVLGPRLLPAYQDAKIAEENLNLTRFTYELEVKLKPDGLRGNQKQLLNTLSDLTGLEQESLYHLNIKGSVDGDVLYAVIYPQGQSEPLTELYLSESQDVVNLAMLYNVIHRNYAAGNPLIAAFMPVWTDHEFVTLNQLEQMFELDLKAVKEFELPLQDVKPSAEKIFVALAVMGREKDDEEWDYALQWNDMKLRVNFSDDERKEIEAALEAKNPEELLDKVSEKLSRFNINISVDKLIFMDDISLEAVFGAGDALQIPQDLVSQSTVETLTGLKDVIKELSGK